jgi:hypothetical protein
MKIMATEVLVSVDEYLRTGYRPDCDYLDGEVVPRNLGEFEHSRAQNERFYSFLESITPSSANGYCLSNAFRCGQIAIGFPIFASSRRKQSAKKL